LVKRRSDYMQTYSSSLYLFWRITMYFKIYCAYLIFIFTFV
jgi:hypothetical protein